MASFFKVQINKELYLLFAIFDENLSWYLEENIAMISADPAIIENEDFQKSNKMNGKILNGGGVGYKAERKKCFSRKCVDLPSVL